MHGPEDQMDEGVDFFETFIDEDDARLAVELENQINGISTH